MAAGRFDPDFLARLQALGATKVAGVTTAAEYRSNANAFIGALTKPLMPKDTSETRYQVTSYDGAEITLHRLVKDNTPTTGSQPALMYFHGGGVIACPVDDITRPMAAKVASDSGVQVFAVEYRLTPEHPYPTPVEDCYAGLKWVSEHASELGIDPARIGIFGESGGATMAAGVALLARDRKFSPPIAKQMLIYPMIDDRCTSRLNRDDSRWKELEPWASMIDVCWKAYVGEEKAGKADADVPQYAAASRAGDLRGLPSSYVEVGTMDAFRDDSIEYGARLAAADVDVEMHVYSGLPHVFDLIAPDIPATLNALENRYRAIRGI